MSKALQYCLLALVALSQGALAAPLVTAEWLAANLQRPDLVVIDASPPRQHAAAHIPGAVNVDIFGFFGRELPAAEMERRIQSWGVGAGKQVVVYDEGGTYYATSLLFELHHYGFPAERVVVLDGGLAKWQATGGAVTKDPTPAPKPGDFRIGKRNEQIRTRLPEFLGGSGDPANHALVEALEPAQHFGGMKFFDRAGHVPNAIMLPTADLFNADKTFKSREEIARLAAHLGIRPEQTVLSHCGGGIAASGPFFALKFIAGYPNVKLYKESQLEWLRDDRNLPFWTYDAPHLVRDRQWVDSWGKSMLRGFGVSNISVVDLRGEDEFKQGRVPFAINVPAHVFRANAQSPAKLAQALGQAGVVPSHEAVIVSKGGITSDAALAFVMLERLGQKRISILPDSMDDWGLAGLTLEKENDEKARAARGRFIVPVSYAPAARSDARASLYPKVHLATGKAPPARAPEGRVLHVPYTDLLDANGRPKPAMEIWNILAKAGLTRYAEIVTVADDPGDAAAGYFILRLMGYPDVKVASL